MLLGPLFAGGILAGCAVPPSEVTPKVCSGVDGFSSLQVTLMFGLGRPGGGGPVTADEWSRFVRDTVTPRFPDGLSMIETSGQWRDRKTNVVTHESSRYIQIITPDTPDVADRIQAIRTAYKAQFSQQSVGLQISRGCASF